VPEKQLTESAWKTFAKGKTYKDDALLKAFQGLVKSEKGSHDDQLVALDAVDKQADVLRKANKADKALVDYLDEIDSALSRQRKAVEQAIKVSAKPQKDDEEEADSPSLLTSKMLPLLRELRKGEVRMHAMVCLVGKDTAVLIMKRPISASRRKVLAEAIGTKGVAKYLLGECVFEAGALTFIFQAGAAGLAKRLRVALFEQVQLRLKVRVRSDDGEDTDGEEGEDGEGQAGGSSDKSAAAQAYTQRLNLLKKRIAQAIQDQHPETVKIRTLLTFANDKATGQQDFVSAGKSLDALEKLLDTASAPKASPQAPKDDKLGSKDEAAAFTHRLTALLPAIKAAALSHPKADTIRAKTNEAGVAARGRDFVSANALLDDVEKLLAAPGKPGKPLESPQVASSGPSEQDVRDRVNTLGLRLRELAKHPDFEKLRAQFTTATNALRSKDMQGASDLLDLIDADITKALSAARGQEVQPDNGPSLRQMAQAALSWREACARARSEVALIQAGVIAELEAEDEWDAEEIEAVRTELERLNGVFDTLKPQLSDLIDTVISLSADKRKPVLTQVLTLVKRSQGQISKDPMIEAARNNGVHDVDLATPALAALNTLQTAIEPMLAA